MNGRSKGVIIWIVTIVIFSGIIGLYFYKSFEGDTVKEVESDNKKTIAIVLKALDSQHWHSMKKGAEAAANDLDVNVIVLAPDKESNVEMQFQMLEDLISSEVDAIGIAPCDSAGVVPLIMKAQEKGIVVVTLDTNAQTEVLSFIGTDNYLAGKMAGERFVEILDGKGHVGLITGVIKQQTHQERVQGFKDAVEDTEIEIDWIKEADSNSVLAMKVMDDKLKESTGHKLNGVFATNALMTLGVLEAVQMSGQTIKIIGFDLQMELFDSIDKGDIDSIIAQNPYGMGYEAVNTMMLSLNNEEVPTRVDTGTEVITNANVADYKKFYEN
ncbi:sugar ABC transporter substrate-binding protein [Vallitalea okinawensis]|uniref:sugar ABC transporter substrate-binding protein n=1 Tax=Vallitalea okinawensis TaxID=2078660 RepID=UPI000CFDD23E|nr:substrate-binding domain-containing protein [Vallitalea okinawensis]